MSDSELNRVKPTKQCTLYKKSQVHMIPFHVQQRHNIYLTKGTLVLTSAFQKASKKHIWFNIEATSIFKAY